MPVNRIINQINLRKSDSVILIYGQVNDTFVTGDLSMYNADGIEKILCRYLRENGYDQIIFYAPERQLYAYDERSVRYCLPEQSVETEPTDPNIPSGMNGRPLGPRKIMKSRTTNTISGTASTQSISQVAPQNTMRWHREGFLSVVDVRSDAAIVDIIREAFFQNKRKSAVVFSQFDNAEGVTEIQRLLLPLIPRLQRRTGDNKCIIITNAVDQQKLKEVVDGVPVLNKIVKMEDAGKGLDSLIYIGYPQKDEIRNLINRLRIIDEKEVEWSQFERIVTGLDQGRDELKRWEREFMDVERFDIPSINKGLQPPLSEDEQSAFKKLDALVGLANAKNALRRHLIQIRDLRENSPQERPLMHIVLKGNPGTGKTTLARLIAEIFREEGLLERGHLVEVDRERLVAGYIGQTAMKTDSCCKDAMGGVLFVDEAYSLAPKENNNGGGGGQDFGKEAIDTLIKRMTDWQDRFCVILAGYPEDMDRLLAANPGFTGRIGLTLTIEDYKPEELTRIFCLRAERSHRIVTTEFEAAMLNVFTNLYLKRGKKFDNARTVEQMLGKVNGLHLERCIREHLDRKDTPYTNDDIPSEVIGYVQHSTPEGEAMDRLNELIGLEKAKNQIQRQIAMIQAERELSGFSKGRRLHMIFKGNPGTGKTTIARLVGEIYQHYQILPNNNFVEASRKDLVGAYQGQTTQRVESICKEALGGILFIDEAYTLVNGESDSYGREAVDALLKIMEDDRENLCVIMAGYPNKMRDFLETNPGLKRRFSAEIEFEDYNAEQLYRIFQAVVRKKGIRISPDLEDKMQAVWRVIVARKDDNFGNAGEVENLVQQILENLAVRCLNQRLDLRTTHVILEDVPENIVELLPVDNPDDVIEKAMEELNGLVGLTSVKNHVKGLIREYKHERLLRKRNPNLKSDIRNYHMIFKGNPGTGKTTVARIMGKIFRALDILKEGNVIEVTRADFVAGYTGQTAEKTRKLVKNSLDNILFIDEAYSLVNDVSDSFGREATDTLLKLIEDHRDRLVVIATGYPREMRIFLRTNSGLASRFPNEINFTDYTDAEMLDIFKLNIKNKGYQLSEGLDEELLRHLRFMKAKKGLEFGNARDVKHFLDKVVMPLYMNRVSELSDDDESFWLITDEDLPPLEDLQQVSTDGQAKTKPASEFSPQQEKNDQRNATAAISHSGSGDAVEGGKHITTNNYIGVKDKELPQALTQLPEMQGVKIYGRDELVSEIHSQLFGAGKSNKVVLYGLPGAGKTKTIIRFLMLHQEPFQHVIWLEVRGSIQKTLIEHNLLLESLGIDFKEGEKDDVRFERVLMRLRGLEKTSLLVLDNLPESEMAKFKELSLSNFKIIASTHKKSDAGYPILIGALPKDAAKSLFTSICPDRLETGQLEGLLLQVSCHALAVEILAKVFAGNPNMTFDSLMEKVAGGLHIRQEELDLPLNLEGAPEVIDTFKTLFQLSELSDTEKEYLVYFSVLPAYPIPIELLHELLRLEEASQRETFGTVLNSLQKKGFVVEEKGRGYFSHQIVQTICKEDAQLCPTLDNCRPLFDSLGFELGHRIDTALVSSGLFILVNSYLPILELFVSHFKEDELFSHGVFINLSILYRVNGQFEESVRVSAKESLALQAERQNFPHWYSIVQRNLAFAESCKGEQAAAESHYIESVEFLESLNWKEHSQREAIEQELMFGYAHLGQLQLRSEKHDIPSALGYFDKGLEIADNASRPNPIALASLKEGAALACIEQYDHRKAVRYLLDAKKLLTQSHGMEKNSLPVGSIDISLALAYAGEKNFAQAKYLADEALSTLQKHLPEGSFDFCRAYHVSAMVRLQEVLDRVEDHKENIEDYVGILEKSSESLQKAIGILVKNRGPQHEDLAMMYSNHGLILQFMGKADAAYEQQKMGIEIYQKMKQPNDLVAGMYFRTVMFFGDSISIEESERYLQNCLHIIPNIWENLLDIGLIHFCLAELRQKQESLREALVSSGEALVCVRRFHEKENNSVGSDKDSPLEVVCLQQMAAIHSAIGTHGEHIKAIECQKEAIDLCEAHMALDDEELAEPYLLMSRIYLNAAKAIEDMKLYADSLEYKIKANALNPKLVQLNNDLEDSGELFMIMLKNQQGKTEKHCVVIPNAFYSQFDIDYKAGKVADLNQYGYVVQPENSSAIDFIGMVKIYTTKYGQLREYEGNKP
jgi:SpoVK/Ycf46/Vps4 family AAA+-type ATPase/tetratricopeptide (TPR) repeat protein